MFAKNAFLFIILFCTSKDNDGNVGYIATQGKKNKDVQAKKQQQIIQFACTVQNEEFTIFNTNIYFFSTEKNSLYVCLIKEHRAFTDVKN